jgi:hypothetical protein
MTLSHPGSVAVAVKLASCYCSCDSSFPQIPQVTSDFPFRKVKGKKDMSDFLRLEDSGVGWSQWPTSVILATQ